MSPPDSKRMLYITAAVLCTAQVFGAPPLNEKQLDQVSMEALGFAVTSFQEGSVYFAQLHGPREVEGCPARRAGSFLFGPAEEVLAFQSTWFESSGEIPQPVAEVSFGGAVAVSRLFIDYICADSQTSARYTIDVGPDLVSSDE
jgi:hypothetical protein